MAKNTNRTTNSMETILTYDNKDVNQWSAVWSTTQIVGMDNAAGSGSRRRVTGRRQLRLSSLAFGAFLTMHCRVAASALTGGFFVFILFLIVAVVALANPLRHFEVYLGQWSINGPGRAFRIIPMLDGIGIAMCINTLVRAINCCTVAAIAAIYVLHSVADAKLPFTYCRDFELKPYDPILKDVTSVMLRESRFSLETGDYVDNVLVQPFTVGLNDNAWRNTSQVKDLKMITVQGALYQIEMCNEKYYSGYPSLFSTPAYNFFYVEVVAFRSDYNLGQFNMTLVLSLVVAWAILWILIYIERLIHGRLVWNNMYTWLVGVPWVWVVLLIITAIVNLASMPMGLRKIFRIGTKEVLTGITDALEVALYIHSSSVGTELIHGKGLNHYASGHIDPLLNIENVWYSGVMLLMTALHSGGAAVCALVDCVHPNNKHVYNMHESTLWIIPMYSKCVLISKYSHLMSTLIFGGMMFSYITVAFVLVKTALHIIFEYKVKLIFAEQAVISAVIVSCMGLSLLYATNGGIALLESVDAVMTGISVPVVCLLELIALLYVYRSHDFVSDMNIATEENTCSTRISTQWQLIPFITFATLAMKVSVVIDAEMPYGFMYAALAPLACVVVAVPLRAAHNVYIFLHPATRRNA